MPTRTSIPPFATHAFRSAKAMQPIMRHRSVCSLFRDLHTFVSISEYLQGFVCCAVLRCLVKIGKDASWYTPSHHTNIAQRRLGRVGTGKSGAAVLAQLITLTWIALLSRFLPLRSDSSLSSTSYKPDIHRLSIFRKATKMKITLAIVGAVAAVGLVQGAPVGQINSRDRDGC